MEVFGARGFIRETDKYDKEGEFRAWLEEVKKQSLESLAKWCALTRSFATLIPKP